MRAAASTLHVRQLRPAAHPGEPVDSHSFLYPGTQVPINKAEIRNPARFSRFERNMTEGRLAELEEHPLRGQGVAVLQQTHWRLHRDVYAWAGEFRTVAPLREHEGIQPMRVVKVADLQRRVGEVMKRIDAESAQPPPLKEQLVERMTITTAQLTFLSPFVKGNSLTRNTLVMSLAQQAGYQLDLNRVRALEVNEAAAAAEQMDFSDLRNLIRSHTAAFRALTFSQAKSATEIAAAVTTHPELAHVYRTIDLASELLHGERQAVIARQSARVTRYLQHRLNEGHIPTEPTRESVQDLLMHLVKQREL